MREFDLGAYRKLCESLDIPVLAAETSDGVHWNAATWIDDGALDMMRTSSFYKGGITGALKIAHLAEAHGMKAQVHGMGLANAQLCAAIPNNDYYEQLVFSTEHIKVAEDRARAADRRWLHHGARRAGHRPRHRLGGVGKDRACHRLSCCDDRRICRSRVRARARGVCAKLRRRARGGRGVFGLAWRREAGRPMGRRRGRGPAVAAATACS